MTEQNFELAKILIESRSKFVNFCNYQLTNEQAFDIAGVSSSGYYAWIKRLDKDTPSKKDKLAETKRIKECFKKIIKKRGYVPGKKTFRDEMKRRYNTHISIKKCRKIMQSMHLVANKPKKDAYKHQATHDHVCTTPKNHVNQDFYVAPRTIILTDITYLYFGQDRTSFYTCVFKDAYTKEILGYSSSSTMTVALVKEAYNMMMSNHSHQFKRPKVYIHSDQGSQYLATTFKHMLEDDGFIQSVSGRGNSQDNAPMESFFGTMKTRIIDLVALCPTLEIAKEMVAGYINYYNHEFYQYNLAGLTPSEFYTYTTTGIYPCDEYFGVEALKLNTVEQLVEKRTEYAKRKQEREKRYKHNSVNVKNQLNGSPMDRAEKDIRVVKKLLREWNNALKTSTNQITKLKQLIKSIDLALDFLTKLKEENVEAYNKLLTPQEWQKYEELSYIYEMKEMF